MTDGKNEMTDVMRRIGKNEDWLDIPLGSESDEIIIDKTSLVRYKWNLENEAPIK